MSMVEKELMRIVERELKAAKPTPDFPSRITAQIEDLWQNLLKALPRDLLRVAGMSHAEITRRKQEIFESLEASLSAEQKAEMEEQGHLKVEDLTTEQQDMLRQGGLFMWAYQLLQSPPFIEDLDSFNIGFGNYDCPDIPQSHGKRFIAIFTLNPDGGQQWYQPAIEASKAPNQVLCG